MPLATRLRETKMRRVLDAVENAIVKQSIAESDVAPLLLAIAADRALRNRTSATEFAEMALSTYNSLVEQWS